jgi:hypothetical protein
MRESLVDKFPDGIDDFVGQWGPWKRPRQEENLNKILSCIFIR